MTAEDVILPTRRRAYMVPIKDYPNTLTLETVARELRFRIQQLGLTPLAAVESMGEHLRRYRAQEALLPPPTPGVTEEMLDAALAAQAAAATVAASPREGMRRALQAGLDKLPRN